MRELRTDSSDSKILHLFLIQHLLLQFFHQLTLQVNLIILRSGREQRHQQNLEFR